MFEQELYNQEVESHEGDLFHNYEVRNWNYSKRIYQILAISAILNIFGLAFLANTEVLTARGCDSPFVGRVCQVLDTVYVGSVLFGTDREYVDAEYERIDLGDAEITYIDVSGATPPLSYPEGYFQIANPVQFAMQQQMAANPTTDFMPGFTPNPTIANDLISRPQVTPTPNPNAYDGETPPLFTTSPDKASRLRNRRPGKGNGISDPDEQIADANSNTSNPTVEPTDPVTAVEINKKPMTDFADAVLVKWDAKEVDLNQQFTVVLDGILTKDGKLDPKKSKWDTKKELGDPKMIEIAKQSVEALSQSGWLAYLRNLGVDKINFTLTQNENDIIAVITSSLNSTQRAKSVSSGMIGVISIGKITNKNPSDERTLLDRATVTSEGKNFSVNFKVPKSVAQEMIDRKLKEALAKKQQQPQPNGSAVVKPNDNTARK